MKTFILPLALLLLVSCTEEQVEPPAPDPFLGTWVYSNPDIALDVSFEITKGDETFTFKDINIEYPELQNPETFEYNMEMNGRFAVNAGYERIQIAAGNDSEWIIIGMYHNRIHLKTPDILDVYTMEVHMINREPVVLQDQVFTRID